MTGQDEIEPIRIDADLWSHRDLLERIVQRWFHIVEEMHDVEICLLYTSPSPRDRG